MVLERAWSYVQSMSVVAICGTLTQTGMCGMATAVMFFTGCNMVERTWRSVCGYGILVVYLSDKEVTSLVSCEHVSE